MSATRSKRKQPTVADKQQRSNMSNKKRCVTDTTDMEVTSINNNECNLIAGKSSPGNSPDTAFLSKKNDAATIHAAANTIAKYWRQYRKRYPAPINEQDPISLESWSEIRDQNEPLFVHVSYDEKLQRSTVYWFKADSLYRMITQTGKFANPVTQVVFNDVELRRLQRILNTAPANTSQQQEHQMNDGGRNTTKIDDLDGGYTEITRSDSIPSKRCKVPNLVADKKRIMRRAKNLNNDQAMVDYYETSLVRLIVLGVRQMMTTTVREYEVVHIWKAAVMRRYRQLRTSVRQHRGVFSVSIDKLVERAIEQAQEYFNKSTAYDTLPGVGTANHFILFCTDIEKYYNRLYHRTGPLSSKDVQLRTAVHEMTDPDEIIEEFESDSDDDDDDSDLDDDDDDNNPLLTLVSAAHQNHSQLFDDNNNFFLFELFDDSNANHAAAVNDIISTTATAQQPPINMRDITHPQVILPNPTPSTTSETAYAFEEQPVRRSARRRMPPPSE